MKEVRGMRLWTIYHLNEHGVLVLQNEAIVDILRLVSDLMNAYSRTVIQHQNEDKEIQNSQAQL